MADNASSELRSIRRAIVRQNEALRAKINHILNSADNKTILQDSIVTMRNGRYVIPVKQEHKARVPGIVHDQSGSGSDAFYRTSGYRRISTTSLGSWSWMKRRR